MWSHCDEISLNRNGSLVCCLRQILKDEVNMDANERLVALARMQDASMRFIAARCPSATIHLSSSLG
jgi:hypothetical protein